MVYKMSEKTLGFSDLKLKDFIYKSLKICKKKKKSSKLFQNYLNIIGNIQTSNFKTVFDDFFQHDNFTRFCKSQLVRIFPHLTAMHSGGKKKLGSNQTYCCNLFLHKALGN